MSGRPRRTFQVAPMLTLAFLNGPGEWAVVIVLIVLLFGATRIPQLARSLGRAKAEFHKGAREGAQEPRREDEDVKTP